MHLLLADILEKHYLGAKAANPNETRRKRILQLLHENWPGHTSTVNNSTAEVDLESLDPDPYSDIETPGVLLRTDFSDDDSWNDCVIKFKNAERELLDSLRPPTADGRSNEPQADGPSKGIPSRQDVEMKDGHEDDDSDSDSEEQFPDSVVAIYDPPLTERSRFEQISNIAALRLFDDVDIRQAVPPPPETRTRYNPDNYLIKKNGWQEIYTGPNLWIYDRKSINDGCVRVVEPSGDLYGTATGDSWRARITHIAELQFNMSYLDMKVDFGGLDKWDPQERARNLKEADTTHAY
ncbi:hypothetical protein FA15DRAFT_668408 [Coprinopsis marcescibilis]|uniref:Uncharacterized protein n=1 Tax=Coprinopsis marcescibilis TaxID=230819 RepID=A0A5C3LB69_COPMA|nr:hypothetical protein FA15DRAFT_668408 [Coprinopsis marcescibilis]